MGRSRQNVKHLHLYSAGAWVDHLLFQVPLNQEKTQATSHHFEWRKIGYEANGSLAWRGLK
jgi:hypothetical protein